MRGATYEDEYEEGGSFIGTILLMLLGGAIALAVFDAFNEIYSQRVGLPALDPVGFATQFLEKWLPDYAQYGQYAHYAVGILGYPLGFVLLARPISRMIWPNVHWWVTGLIFGVVLWALSTFGLGQLAMEKPLAFELTDMTWASLAGHVLYGFVLAAVMRDGRYV